MTPIAKLVSSLSTSRASTVSSFPFMFSSLRKQVLVSSTRMCHGAKEKALVEKEAAKTEVSVKDDSGKVFKDFVPKTPLHTWDRVVVYVFSEKGRYKSLQDVPHEVPSTTRHRAYDKQRIYGMMFCVVACFIICIYTIFWTKKDIEESEYYGQRWYENKYGIAREVGFVAPTNFTKRHRDHEVPDYRK